MRLATEIQGELSQGNLQRAESEISRNLSKNHETPSDLSGGANEVSQHLALAAQATNDAVRVWALATGTLRWPQGLENLLGYQPSSATDEIGFWQKQVHPQDRARTAVSLRDALAGDGNHWTGEYRFRHADGSYLDLLERGFIVRDGKGRALQFVGSLMD